jgi:hypothetical protein
MKLGIVILILGVIFASIGLGLRQSGVLQQTNLPLLGIQALQRGIKQESTGIGLLVFGGCLTIGGVPS